MTSTKYACERCGAPALVNITSEEPQGATVRHLCLRCADSEVSTSRQRRRRLNYGAILISVGACILLLSLLADWLAFGVRSEGFGWKQYTGIILAGVLVVTATIVQVPTLLVIGTLLGVLTILADILGFGHAPGFGAHQLIGTLAGLCLVVLGLIESRRRT